HRIQPFADHGHYELSERCLWPAADQFAEHACGRAMDRRRNEAMGHRERSYGAVEVRPRLVERRFSAMMISPRPYILIAYPLAWTPGTNGAVTAPAVLAMIQSEQDLDKYRGQ